MRCRTTEHAKRVQWGGCFFCLWCIIYALGFINNNNRSDILNISHCRFPVKLLLWLIDDIFHLFECVNIDDHNLNVSACGKLVYIRQFGRIIDRIPVWYTVILQDKILFCNFKRFVNTSSDCQRRHCYNKLCKAVFSMNSNMA